MQVHVTIIGLDRLGGSIGLALKRYQTRPDARHSFVILGSDNTNEPMKAAQKIGAIDDFHRDKVKAVENAELVITNLPYGQTEGLLARIGPALKPGAVVLDLSVLKQPVLQWAREFFPKNAQGQEVAYLVGMTPIVNVSGLYSGSVEVEDARADLFDSSEILIAPDTSCPPEAVQLAEDVARLMGGKPRFIDPAEHDALIAATEELPALLGATLFYTLERSEGWAELQRMVNPTLALAIQSLRLREREDALALLSYNRTNVLRHLDNLIARLNEVRGVLAAPPENGELEAFLDVVYGAWQKWDVKRYSGNWDDARAPEKLPGPLSSMGGMLFGRLGRKSDEDKDDE
jgi:prephenate dehydrogenase